MRVSLGHFHACPVVLGTGPLWPETCSRAATQQVGPHVHWSSARGPRRSILGGEAFRKLIFAWGLGGKRKLQIECVAIWAEEEERFLDVRMER